MIRGAAGWFVRGWLVKQAIVIAMGLGIVVGLVCGPMFFWVLPHWIGFGGTIVVWGTTAVGLVIAICVGWNIENLRKGLDAETLVGQAIERAITTENCAVAHSVTEIAEGGDIDHIVVTPKAVWVIETKYKWVPKPFFKGVLKRIAANTRAVRKRLPAGTPVRGCLVLAAFSGPPGAPTYNACGEKITVHYGTKSLSRKIGNEGRRRPPHDPIVKEIWKLGNLPE